jgi:aminodeoxyfutalosine synthase
MNTTLPVDKALERIESGATLGRQETLALAGSPDILAAGMLADAQRRLRYGSSVTYLRVATCAFDALAAPPASATGGNELRLTGAPASLREALEGVRVARTLAGARTLAALTWADIVRYGDAPGGVEAVLRQLRQGGLDAVAEAALDGITALDGVLGPLAAAGFDEVRVHVARPAPASDRVEMWFRVAAAQVSAGCSLSVNPLPTLLSTFKPTTGYDDVKAVALARLALPGVAHLQVDWARYGPKLAQVALTFGADDVDNVSASDEAPLGRRRAPLEEIRRNIEAAGFVPVERTGRFAIPAS